MRAADRARVEGRLEEAATTLTTLVTRYPSLPDAPLASFMLGRVQIERGLPHEAMQAYGRSLALGLRDPLAEDAFDRWSEAALAAGLTDVVRDIAVRYERRYPEGRHRASIRGRAGLE
jgi:hypothetical protein